MTLHPNRRIRIPASPTNDDTEAQKRFAKTVDNDPFPSIPPALLNSADIFDYTRATGMICPFYEDSRKSATYGASVGNRVISWNGKEELSDITLKDGETFTVIDNSIVFIQTKETFRLANYLAIRFNLNINNVHRGILLGTGPIVDPGFEGKLLIPLHNLTTNKYTFREGEQFIWVEFTKISPHKSWDPAIDNLTKGYGLKGVIKPFPEDKKGREPWDYLNEARKGPIRSSIPDVLATATKTAERAKTTAEIGLGVILMALLAAFIGGAQILTDLNTRIQTTSEFATKGLTQFTNHRAEIKSDLKNELSTEIVKISRAIDAMKSERSQLDRKNQEGAVKLDMQISKLTRDIEKLSKQIRAMESKPKQPKR